VDVSGDAVPEKTYSLTILFEFSDSKSDDLTDTETAYLRIEDNGKEAFIFAALLAALAAAGLVIHRRRRGQV